MHAQNECGLGVPDMRACVSSGRSLYCRKSVTPLSRRRTLLRFLRYNEGAMPPYNATELAYADSFQSIVRGVVTQLPAAAQPGSAVFSSACFRRASGGAGDEAQHPE